MQPRGGTVAKESNEQDRNIEPDENELAEKQRLEKTQWHRKRSFDVRQQTRTYTSQHRATLSHYGHRDA